MAGSMPLTLLPLTFACLFSDGQSSVVQNRVSESTHRLTSLRRYLCSIESQMQRCMMSIPWIGLHMNLMRAMSLIEGTLTLPVFIESMLLEHSLSLGKRDILHMRLLTVKTFLMEKIMFSRIKVFALPKGEQGEVSGRYQTHCLLCSRPPQEFYILHEQFLPYGHGHCLAL